jgi:RHS repeat-associated protein
MIIRIDYPEPSVRLDLWGGASGTFAGIDRFNRVTDQRWQNDTSSTPTDIDRYQYGYDRDSNRTWKANVVGTPAVSGGLDELYAYDRVNRLNQMQRGTLNSTRTAITGTPTIEQDWTLDPTGNWSGFLTKASGTTNLNQSRTSNPVNEITNISESTGPTWVTPAYDAAGNTTTMPQVADPTQSFTATYDAWNRMTGISDSSGTVATYQYDGRNRRIVKTTTATGEIRHFYYTNAWQDVEERVGTATTADNQYVWGVRYVDELVCRDDATPQRLYACQDANFNVTAITNTSGAVQERFVYEPYGVHVVMTAGWSVTSDGYEWTATHQGLRQDKESELIQNRRRTLHPRAGRFGERDPIGYALGLNQYEYLKSLPTIYTDWNGLRPTTSPSTQPSVTTFGKCNVVVLLEDEGTGKAHPVAAGPCGAIGILACYANQFNQLPDNKGPAPGTIQGFPDIPAPIGGGYLDNFTHEPITGYTFSNDKADYNGHHQNAGGKPTDVRNAEKNKPFVDLIKEALQKALDQAKELAKNCRKCDCRSITVSFQCGDKLASDWSNAVYTTHASDWNDWDRPNRLSLCGMSKKIDCT